MNKHARQIFTIATILGILIFIATVVLIYLGYLPEKFTEEQMNLFGKISAMALYIFLFLSVIYFLIFVYLHLFIKKIGEFKVKKIQFKMTKWLRAIVMILFSLTMISVNVPLYAWIPAVILSLLFALDSVLS